MKSTIVALALCLVGIPSLTTAQTDRGKPSLSGLGGVFLVVSSIDLAAKRDGLSETRVREIAEEVLKEAHIPLRSEPDKRDGDANLVITIDTIKHPQGVYLFDVKVGVVQMVHLTREPKGAAIPAETWNANAFGLTTPTRMDIIEAPLREKLEAFVKAFQSVNSK